MLGGSGVTTTTTTTTRALPRWQEDVVYALPIEQDATAKVPDEVIRNIEDYILNEDEKKGSRVPPQNAGRSKHATPKRQRSSTHGRNPRASGWCTRG